MFKFPKYFWPHNCLVVIKYPFLTANTSLYPPILAAEINFSLLARLILFQLNYGLVVNTVGNFVLISEPLDRLVSQHLRPDQRSCPPELHQHPPPLLLAHGPVQPGGRRDQQPPRRGGHQGRRQYFAEHL